MFLLHKTILYFTHPLSYSPPALFFITSFPSLCYLHLCCTSRCHLNSYCLTLYTSKAPFFSYIVRYSSLSPP